MGKPERSVQDHTIKYARKIFDQHGIKFDYETRTATQYGGAGLADTDWTIGLGWAVDVEFKTAGNKLSKLQAYKQQEQNRNHVIRPYFCVSSKQGGRKLVDYLFKIYVTQIEPFFHTFTIEQVDFK